MWRVQPRKRNYSGPVDIDKQPATWIGKHRGLADRAWLDGRVRYGEWVRDRQGPGYFLIYDTQFEGRKSLTILIKIRKFSTHVLVYHIHVLRKKE
jgi:hypothetical protein